jgi:hypothetical protein
MDEQLKARITKALLTCAGIDELADVFLELAQDAQSEHDRAIWTEAFTMLTGEGLVAEEWAVDAGGAE